MKKRKTAKLPKPVRAWAIVYRRIEPNLVFSLETHARDECDPNERVIEVRIVPVAKPHDRRECGRKKRRAHK